MRRAVVRQSSPGYSPSCESAGSVTAERGQLLAQLGAVLAHARVAGIYAALDQEASADAVTDLLEQIHAELERTRGRFDAALLRRDDV